MSNLDNLTVTQLYRSERSNPNGVDLLVGVQTLDDMKEAYRRTLDRADDFDVMTVSTEGYLVLTPQPKTVLHINRTVHSYPELMTLISENPTFKPLLRKVRAVYHVRPKPVLVKPDPPNSRGDRRA